MNIVTAHVLLLEGRIDYLKKSFADKVGFQVEMVTDILDLNPPAAHPNTGEVYVLTLADAPLPLHLRSWIGELAIDRFAEADPTAPRHKYLQWMIGAYLRRDFGVEDLGQVGSDLETLAELSRRKIIRGVDLGQLTYKELKAINDEHGDKTSKRQEDKAAGEKMIADGHADVILDGPRWKVIELKDEDASCYFGRGTRWCTAGTKGDNMFESYASSGPLYVIFDKLAKRKYQLWYARNNMPKLPLIRVEEGENPLDYNEIQLMDEQDNSEDLDLLKGEEELLRAVGLEQWIDAGQMGLEKVLKDAGAVALAYLLELGTELPYDHPANVLLHRGYKDMGWVFKKGASQYDHINLFINSNPFGFQGAASDVMSGANYRIKTKHQAKKVREGITHLKQLLSSEDQDAHNALRKALGLRDEPPIIFDRSRKAAEQVFDMAEKNLKVYHKRTS